MFTFHSWPKRKSRPKSKTGRPKNQYKLNQTHPRLDLELDGLYTNGHINEQEYKTALWYQKAYHLYLSVIKAPCVKTTTYDLATIRGDIWPSHYSRQIERNWKSAKKILLSHDPHTQRVVNQVICLNQPCNNVNKLKNFLFTLYNAK